MNEDTLKVGACSMAAIPGNTEENIKKIKGWVKAADKEGLDLLLFPELSLSGYWWNNELIYEGQPRDGPAIQELIAFMKSIDSSMVISVGLAEYYGACLYNTQILLSRDGEFNYYRKTHWPHDEMGTWSCGDRFSTFVYNGITLGTAICYDNTFPEVHRIYALKGTDLILSPYAYGQKFDPNQPETVKKSILDWKTNEKKFLQAAAAANYQWIVAVVGGGHVKDYIAESQPGMGQECFFPGVILFIDPSGKVVLESPDDLIEERLLSYNISRIANMEQRRSKYNHFKDRRTAIYGRITELP